MDSEAHQNSEQKEFDPKENRLENPSGWMRLTRYESVRYIIDALLESPPNYDFNKSELARRTGISRESIRKHIEFLVELGIVEKIDDRGWAEYRLNDEGRVTRELFSLNSAVNAVLGGQTKNLGDTLALNRSTLQSFNTNAGQQMGGTEQHNVQNEPIDQPSFTSDVNMVRAGG